MYNIYVVVSFRSLSLEQISSILISLIVCLLFGVSLVRASQPESDSAEAAVRSLEGQQLLGQKQDQYPDADERIFSLFHMLVSQPSEKEISPLDKTVSSPDQINISLNERLSAVFSLGMPFLRDIAGKQIKTDYRGLFGFRIAF